jgi:hypothetical protein
VVCRTLGEPPAGSTYLTRRLGSGHDEPTLQAAQNQNDTRRPRHNTASSLAPGRALGQTPRCTGSWDVALHQHKSQDSTHQLEAATHPVGA